ncbi:MAG: hypothetical protein Q4B94_07670 [Pseudomonadota bacterium]|nr:hypothetical protein [Pseudomonadota bacterium]
MTASPLPRISLTGLFLLLLGASGAAALWVMLAFTFNLPAPVFAFVACADLLIMTRLARLAPGRWRGAQAALGTALAIALAQWGLMATHVGLQLGMLPWEAIPKMGLGFAWILSGFWLAPLDWCLYAAAIALAAWLGR